VIANPTRYSTRRPRSPTLPAWATTPFPSSVTDRPDDHEVPFTYGVPSFLEFLNHRKSKNPKGRVLPSDFLAGSSRRTVHALARR
jgi:hypothetical protein